MKQYLGRFVGVLSVLSLFLPFAFTPNLKTFEIVTISGWVYFSGSLFAILCLALVLAFCFKLVLFSKTVNLLLFAGAGLMMLYFYSFPLQAVGSSFLTRLDEFPVGYFLCGVFLVLGLGFTLKELLSQ
ncbi:TPA: hypothetical protein ACHVHO_000456 [Streptococcus suis]